MEKEAREKIENTLVEKLGYRKPLDIPELSDEEVLEQADTWGHYSSEE